ncbi:hypothetical protein SLS58_007682 [Diplodia intermedia]|uniref:FMN-dependent dehydrogenase domain-containing protein n=1 Tax=Diplodia intermedia TaxID=856260 RepID=A0ABR3TJB0_9PEZI
MDADGPNKDARSTPQWALAFYRHRIVPRMLVDTNTRDTAPIGFAPIGINKIYNPAGELPRREGRPGSSTCPTCLSTAAGSQPIEAVAAAQRRGPARFFQLYMPHDDELTVSLLTRGARVRLLRVHLDRRYMANSAGGTTTSPPATTPSTTASARTWGSATPVFQKRLAEAGIDPAKQPNEAGAKWIDSVWHGRAHSWEKMPWLVRTWKDISGGAAVLHQGRPGRR